MGRTSSKQVICLETKEIFSTVGEAARSVNRKLCTMSRHLNGDRASCGGKHFQFYQDWLEDQRRQELIQTLKPTIVMENEDGMEISFDDIDEVGDYFYLEITGDEY